MCKASLPALIFKSTISYSAKQKARTMAMKVYDERKLLISLSFFRFFYHFDDFILPLRSFQNLAVWLLIKLLYHSIVRIFGESYWDELL